MIKARRILLHVVFWLVSVLFLSFFLRQRTDDFTYTLIFVGLLLPVAIATSYTFGNYLIPKYLLNKRYLEFGIYGALTFVISIYLEMLIMLFVFVFVESYSIERMQPFGSNIFLMAVALYFVILIFAVVKVFRMNYRNSEKNKTVNNLQIRSERKTFLIDFDKVLFIESLDNYVQVHTTDKILITKDKISKILERLPEKFIRIHRSYVANTDHIGSFTREKIHLGSTELPISRTYKKDVIEVLKERF